MTDPALRDLLDSAAPDQPDLTPAARTSAVTARAAAVRRRNRLVLAAAAVAVVGVGVAVPVLGSGGDDGTRVASDSTPEVVAPPPCPAEPVDVSTGTSVDALPDGAVSVRECAATVEQAGGSDGYSSSLTLDMDGDPVVDGADEFTAAVRALPAYTLEDECAFTTYMAQPWALVVSYPDGTSATLGSTQRVCATVSVEGVDRSAEAVLALFTSAG